LPNIDNKFNNLGSKEWLPFQKSFTRYAEKESLIRDNLRFFTKPSLHYKPNVRVFGSEQYKITVQKQCADLGLLYHGENKQFDFLLADLTSNCNNLSALLDWVFQFGPKLGQRKFLWILSPTKHLNTDHFPTAWALSNCIAEFLTRKDEKIICLPDGTTWTSLYFRNDELSRFQKTVEDVSFKNELGSLSLKDWFILKPKPRNKNEVLHPAKYPEDLVQMYVQEFTKKNDTVFDPMSGTGTTQVESLQLGRNAYGIELSDLFYSIAQKRCNDVGTTHSDYKIFFGDARSISKIQLPEMDYVITSPPYWNMLNMKGAEVQAARRSKGLKTNYSDSESDLGNLDNYAEFLDALIEIYNQTVKTLKPGGHMTIVVKNIKKKGSHYPLAFDLTESLKEFLELKHVGFWCQDDLQIAPYGYKHTWVSNTFHHYCLTFLKP